VVFVEFDRSANAWYEGPRSLLLRLRGIPVGRAIPTVFGRQMAARKRQIETLGWVGAATRLGLAVAKAFAAFERYLGATTHRSMSAGAAPRDRRWWPAGRGSQLETWDSSGARDVVVRWRCRLRLGCGGPAGQEVEALLGAAAGFGGEDRQP